MANHTAATLWKGSETSEVLEKRVHKREKKRVPAVVVGKKRGKGIKNNHNNNRKKTKKQKRKPAAVKVQKYQRNSPPPPPVPTTLAEKKNGSRARGVQNQKKKEKWGRI